MSAITAWTSRHRLTAFFGIAFTLSWWAWPFYVAGIAPTPFFACGPVIAALVVIALSDGRAGYRDLFARLTRWRVGWAWWAVAVALPLAVVAVAAVANVTIWAAPAPGFGSVAWADIGLFAAVRFVNPLDGPIGEEPGWRAYALPRLQEKWSPLRAGATLGVAVALWHLPLVTSGMLAPFGLVVTFAITLVYVWLVNRTGGSALLAVVFHVAQGAVGSAALGFTGADADRMGWLTGALWCLVAAGLVTADRAAWRGVPAPTRIVTDTTNGNHSGPTSVYPTYGTVSYGRVGTEGSPHAGSRKHAPVVRAGGDGRREPQPAPRRGPGVDAARVRPLEPGA